MAFQIKDFLSITASMINHARSTTDKVTDWIPGSAARTLIEAPGVEIEELYIQMFLGLREAIPVAVFRSFGFDILPAAYARGFVSVSTEEAPEEDLAIPAGTPFSTTDGRTYTSSEAVTWLAGELSTTIPVIAEAPGSTYNATEGVVVESGFFDSSYTVSNQPITSGRDVETDTEREARFASFVASLSRGTIEACRYAASTAVIKDTDGAIIEYVTRIGISETPGFVRIYIYSSAGEPSEELLAIAQRVLDGWRDDVTGEIVPGYRAGGVRTDALPMTERTVPFTASIAMQSGYAITSAVQQDLNDAYATVLANTQPGTVLYVGTIESALLNVTGVLRAVPTVTENIVCGPNEVLKPGTLTITPI